MSSYQHKSGAIKRREKQQRVNAEKKGSRTLFDVGAFKDNAESGSEAELEQASQDIPAQTVVIEPRRQTTETSEVEITDSGAYHAADADVEDEADVDDDDSEKHHLNTCSCEEDSIKSAPIAPFSFDVGTITGSPTPNELEEIVRAGHIPHHPSQFPCDVVGNKFPTSVLKVRKQNGETSSRSWIVFSPKKEAIYCLPCRLFSYSIDQPTQSSLAPPGATKRRTIASSLPFTRIAK